MDTLDKFRIMNDNQTHLEDSDVKHDPIRCVKSKLCAIANVSRCEFPTADIEDMLREIEAGQRILR